MDYTENNIFSSEILVLHHPPLVKLKLKKNLIVGKKNEEEYKKFKRS